MRSWLSFAALASLWIGCSTPPSGTAVDAPPEPTVDADPTPTVDAPPADPLSGKDCPTSAVEITRIQGADIFPGTVGPAFYSSVTTELYARDVDGDSDSDLLLFEYASSSGSSYTYRVRLFRYDAGTLAFAPAVTSMITLPAYGAELDLLADVNGDGRKDLVIGYTTEVPRTPYVYVAQQAASGTFTLQSFPIDVSACGSSNDQRLEAIAVLDVDRDGKDDVLTTVSIGGLGSAPEGLSLAKGTSSGLGSSTCVASATVITPGFPARLANADLLRAGDFDGDGAQDLVAVSYVGGARMQLLVSRGPSDFRPVPGLAAPPTRLLVDRVAGRARDALLGVSVLSDHTDLFRYSTDGQTGIAPAAAIATLPVGHFPSPASVIYGFAASDFNGDRLTDVIEIGNQERVTGPTPFSITCDRSATWQIGRGMFPQESTRILRAIDIDNDGKSELVARVGLDVVVFRLQ